MKETRATVTAVLIGIAIASWTLFAGQLPPSPVRDRGQTITPVYEGWYPNPDGTFSMSFGYFNRNADEELDIPVGSDNYMEPGGPDLGQPTHFTPRRAILQQKCQVCHQPNSIAPMSLLTYREARPWARSIKAKVLAREMPPWHIDKTVGIQRFKNDRSLSDDEIETIVGWVDAGAPQGNPTDAPAPIEWPDPNAWRLAEQFGEPDLIVPSEPYTVPADGQDKWWKSTVDTGLTAERWVKAIEIKPSFPLGRKVVHHAIAGLVQEEDGVTGLAASAANPDDDADIGPGTFMEWAVGKEGEIFPDGDNDE